MIKFWILLAFCHKVLLVFPDVSKIVLTKFSETNEIKVFIDTFNLKIDKVICKCDIANIPNGYIASGKTDLQSIEVVVKSKVGKLNVPYQVNFGIPNFSSIKEYRTIIFDSFGKLKFNKTKTKLENHIWSPKYGNQYHLRCLSHVSIDDDVLRYYCYEVFVNNSVIIERYSQNDRDWFSNLVFLHLKTSVNYSFYSVQIFNSAQLVNEFCLHSKNTTCNSLNDLEWSSKFGIFEAWNSSPLTNLEVHVFPDNKTPASRFRMTSFPGNRDGFCFADCIHVSYNYMYQGLRPSKNEDLCRYKNKKIQCIYARCRDVRKGNACMKIKYSNVTETTISGEYHKPTYKLNVTGYLVSLYDQNRFCIKTLIKIKPKYKTIKLAKNVTQFYSHCTENYRSVKLANDFMFTNLWSNNLYTIYFIPIIKENQVGPISKVEHYTSENYTTMLYVTLFAILTIIFTSTFYVWIIRKCILKQLRTIEFIETLRPIIDKSKLFLNRTEVSEASGVSEKTKTSVKTTQTAPTETSLEYIPYVMH